MGREQTTKSTNTRSTTSTEAKAKNLQNLTTVKPLPLPIWLSWDDGPQKSPKSGPMDHAHIHTHKYTKPIEFVHLIQEYYHSYYVVFIIYDMSQ